MKSQSKALWNGHSCDSSLVVSLAQTRYCTEQQITTRDIFELFSMKRVAYQDLLEKIIETATNEELATICVACGVPVEKHAEPWSGWVQQYLCVLFNPVNSPLPAVI